MAVNSSSKDEGLVARDIQKGFSLFGSVWTRRPRSSRTVLNNLNVSLGPGESVGLIGRTGAGKTTLARVLGGLCEPDSGTVHLEGEEIYRLSPSRWREQRSTLRYVFQNPDVALHPGMTAEEILVEALRRKGNGDESQDSDAVRKLADDYLLHETWMDRYPAQLSLGQRRRLALARSLANQPSYTLLDEPFSGLDRTSKRLLWRVFQNIHHGGRMAILLVSHDVDSVCELCQRILVMRSGILVEEPKRDENGVWQVSHPYTRTLFEHSETPFNSI